MSRRRIAAAMALLVFLASCSRGSMSPEKMRELATDYTAAWSSQRPARVAEHFNETGSLTINGGTPSIGRAAITAAAQGFMTAFPDMVVTMDSLSVVDGNHAVYHWMLTGTNSGPNGTNKSVRIHGYEEWTLADARIEKSLGHYDQAEYDRQLQRGAPPAGK